VEIAIPAGISEQGAKEWMAILCERKINAELNANIEFAKATAKAKEDIDTIREANSLDTIYEVKEDDKLGEVV